jgi:uncharacterized flavoprotein (TIGR03862 family)
VNIAILGGGPAGLRAAEIAVSAGANVTLYEAKASVGRKFLIAGKGGLNLTHSEPLERFASRYSGGSPRGFWASLLTEFDNNALCEWASELGVETFIGTSGRIFPKESKAAPLLRRWVERLRALGVQFLMHHRLEEITQAEVRLLLKFSVEDRPKIYSHDAAILALGGASWPNTGSDGKWTSLLNDLGVAISPLLPANCGWEVNWPQDILKEAEGLPVKNIALSAGSHTILGELLITRYGLEGGALYQLGRTLRSMEFPECKLDLKPTFSAEQLADKLFLQMTGDPILLLRRAILKWRLGMAASSLLKHLLPPAALESPLALARFAKAIPIPVLGPRSIEEAISTSGGVSFSELDQNLMIKRLPGLFVAGEMIDWEAPTGGYLIQGCFATGTRAANGALDYLRNH